MLLFFLLNLLALCKSKRIRGKANVTCIPVRANFCWSHQQYTCCVCISGSSNYTVYFTRQRFLCSACFVFIFFTSHMLELLMMDLNYAFFFLCFFFPFLFFGLRHAACRILVPQGQNPALCSESAES